MLRISHQLRDEINICLLTRITLKMFGKLYGKYATICFKKSYMEKLTKNKLKMLISWYFDKFYQTASQIVCHYCFPVNSDRSLITIVELLGEALLSWIDKLSRNQPHK
jgi:hypothetical protein